LSTAIFVVFLQMINQSIYFVMFLPQVIIKNTENLQSVWSHWIILPWTEVDIISNIKCSLFSVPIDTYCNFHVRFFIHLSVFGKWQRQFFILKLVFYYNVVQ